jgi:hypothetical protein
MSAKALGDATIILGDAAKALGDEACIAPVMMVVNGLSTGLLLCDQKLRCSSSRRPSRWPIRVIDKGTFVKRLVLAIENLKMVARVNFRSQMQPELEHVASQRESIFETEPKPSDKELRAPRGPFGAYPSDSGSSRTWAPK